MDTQYIMDAQMRDVRDGGTEEPETRAIRVHNESIAILGVIAPEEELRPEGTSAQ